MLLFNDFNPKAEIEHKPNTAATPLSTKKFEGADVKFMYDNKRQYITIKINTHSLFNKVPCLKVINIIPAIDNKIARQYMIPNIPNAKIITSV